VFHIWDVEFTKLKLSSFPTHPPDTKAPMLRGAFCYYKCMATTSSPIHSARIKTEGDELFYEIRGKGQPIILIPPAGGDGWHYAKIAEILADEYKVITFDRRANARSTINNPQNFEMSQQSRDVIAVLRAAGETSAFVFGNSSGAAIALDVAKTQPQAVRAVIAHEPPTARVHPQSKKWQSFFAHVYAMSFRYGSSMAALRFFFGIQVPALKMVKATAGPNAHQKQSKDPYIDPKTATDFLVRQELLPVTNYLPDTARIKQNKVEVIMGVSEYARAKKTWLAEITRILAKQLDCKLVTFPGHHGSFLDMSEEFAAVLRSVLKEATLK